MIFICFFLLFSIKIELREQGRVPGKQMGMFREKQPLVGNKKRQNNSAYSPQPLPQDKTNVRAQWGWGPGWQGLPWGGQGLSARDPLGFS